MTRACHDGQCNNGDGASERESVSELQLLTKSFCYNTHLVWTLMTDQRQVVIIMKFIVEVEKQRRIKHLQGKMSYYIKTKKTCNRYIKRSKM